MIPGSSDDRADAAAGSSRWLFRVKLIVWVGEGKG
jgi:hypothetical protein